MKNLNLLIVEGNIEKENNNFKKNGIQTHAESLQDSLEHYANNLNIDVFNPCSEKSFNKKFIEKKIVSVCDYLSLEKNFEAFLNWILDLRKELNIPHKLSEVVDENKINLKQLSEMALEDPSTSTNPKKMTLDDMKILYQHSISGKLF